eukprot:5324341-Alexandrium_andersonii.AAC.1
MPLASGRQAPPTLLAELVKHPPAKPSHGSKQNRVHQVDRQHVHVDAWKASDGTAILAELLHEHGV